VQGADRKTTDILCGLQNLCPLNAMPPRRVPADRGPPMER
jgi:hypothetical protein